MTDTEKLYPYDMNIWLRSCEQEIKEPLAGKLTGSIPSWLGGTLIRNGPGCNKIGDCQYEHVFDGLALLHRFSINKGQVTYQCKFIQSNTYKKNTTAKRIVITEFGTSSVPDPCRSIFDRISSAFTLRTEKTDNTSVSVYPFGDQIYALTEVPVLYKIDPKSLETVGKEQIEDSLIVCHTAHPHVMPNGDVYNVGLSKSNGLKHVVVKFSYSDKGDMFDSAEVVGTMTPRWKLNPAYMHSFGITENYFVLIEQPLVISMLSMVRQLFVNLPLASALTSYPDEETQIVLIHRKTGEETRYTTDSIFFMHIINCFELNNKVTIDLCSYKNAKIIDCMYVDAIKSMQNNPDYGQWCECRPKRIEVPLDEPDCKVEATLIADIGCEAPKINYELYNARPYRYFYGIGSDIDKMGAGCIVKIDTKTGDFQTWQELDAYPSEPVFVARPDAVDEDEGVLLSAVVWGDDEHAVTLLVLNAQDLSELARAHFDTPSQAPKCFHGWFLPDQGTLFSINKGQVTYQCKFIQSNTYKKNTTAKRIVITEFGTSSVPDPCRSIFDRISSAFTLHTEKTDNTSVSVYPFGDQIYALTEVPVLYKIDPKSLETVGKEQIEDSLIVCHTAHPHVMPNGDVYNVGLSKSNGLKHVVVKFSYSDKGDMFDSAEVVGTMTPRWKLNPAYMHSFGITENYFVLIEQPLVISMLSMVRQLFVNLPLASALTSYPDEETQIVLIHRKTGEETRYTTDSIFFMHIINCFELNNKVTIDLCSYKNAKIIDCMYVDAIKSMQNNPDYGQWCECRPKRIEVPLDEPDCKVEATLIADIGCEAPRINYELYNARPYRYFYGIGSDIDKMGAGCIVKIDTKTGDFQTWQELEAYPSEPVFVARPDAVVEDEGVLLSAVVWGGDEHAVTLLVLNAQDLSELARAHFDTPSQAPKCFHGWFLPDQGTL